MDNSKLARVVLWMVGALLSFSVMAVSIRQLAAHGLNIFEILGIRSGVALLVLSALLLARADLRPYVRPRRMKLHLLRNSVHYAAQYCWALSLTMLPLAMVFALEFTMPAWTALLAVWLLHERLTPSRIGVVVLGLVGVLVILRPGSRQHQSGRVPGAGRRVRFCGRHDRHQKLTATETTFGIVFWMSVIQFPLALAGGDPLLFVRMGPGICCRHSGSVLPA